MAAIRLNEQAKPFTLPGIDDKQHSLTDYKDKDAVVVIFSCNHCPYVKAWRIVWCRYKRTTARRACS